MSSSEKVASFFKSVKWKRLSSLMDGFISGFILGMILLGIWVGQFLETPFPPEVVLVGAMFSVAMFVWGVHSAITTKDIEKIKQQNL